MNLTTRGATWSPVHPENVRPAGTGSTKSRYRYGSGRARLAGSSTTETTMPPKSFSPPVGRRD